MPSSRDASPSSPVAAQEEQAEPEAAVTTAVTEVQEAEPEAALVATEEAAAVALDATPGDVQRVSRTRPVTGAEPHRTLSGASEVPTGA